MQLFVRVLKPFGYHAEHEPGETFDMNLEHVTECIQKGYVEIVVNNMGNNVAYDEPETPPFLDIDVPFAVEEGSAPIQREENLLRYTRDPFDGKSISGRDLSEVHGFTLLASVATTAACVNNKRGDSKIYFFHDLGNDHFTFICDDSKYTNEMFEIASSFAAHGINLSTLV